MHKVQLNSNIRSYKEVRLVDNEVQILESLKVLQNQVAELKEQLQSNEVRKIAFTVDEVSRMLDIAPLTVRKLISGKQLKAIKVGRILKIPKAFIDEYIQNSVLGEAN